MKLEDDLSSMGCPKCQGTLISLLHYRDWVERTGGVQASIESAELSKDATDTTVALACSKCKRLMTKYRISGAANNRLDLCPSCDDAWLDGGEWELLKLLSLGNNIPKVLTEQWQRKVRSEVSEDARRKRLTEHLNENDVSIAIEFYEWIKSHPQRREILRFVNHR